MRSHGGSASRASVTVVLMLSSFVVLVLFAFTACGGSSDTASNSPSAAASGDGATPLPTPTVAGTIAFSKVVEQGVSDDIYVVNADGTGLTQLTDDLGYEEHPDWSPDGSRILYTHYRKLKGEDNFSDQNVWVMNADGSGKVQLTKHLAKGALWDLYATWSPDGKQIAFNRVRWKKMSVDVFVMNADGSDPKLVPTRPHPMDVWEAWRPSWTPDGKILYLHYDGYLCAVNPDGSGRVRLTKDSNFREYALSPDGKMIAKYDVLYDRAEAFPTRGGGARATLLDPVSDFITGNLIDKYAWAALAWTPDGQALALASTDAGVPRGSRLYIVDADGSGLSAVPGIDRAMDPSWRPEKSSASDTRPGGEARAGGAGTGHRLTRPAVMPSASFSAPRLPRRNRHNRRISGGHVKTRPYKYESSRLPAVPGRLPGVSAPVGSGRQARIATTDDSTPVCRFWRLCHWLA